MKGHDLTSYMGNLVPDGLWLRLLKIPGSAWGASRHFGVLLARCVFSSTKRPHPGAWCYKRGHLLWPQRSSFVFTSAGVDHLPHCSWVCSCIGNLSYPPISLLYRNQELSWVYYLWSVYQTQPQHAEKLDLWDPGKPRNKWINRKICILPLCVIFQFGLKQNIVSL